MRDLLDAFNGVTKALMDRCEKEISELEQRLEAAMKFVPHPETMSGYFDPSAPDEVKELIGSAAWLHGKTLPIPELLDDQQEAGEK